MMAASAFTLSMFFRTSAAVIAPQLSEELSLDSAQLGLLSAAFFYAFAACQIPLVLVLDRVGARATMLVLAGVGVLGALVFAWSDTPAMAVTGRALLGVGMSANLMGPMALLAAWFRPALFATLSGVLMALGNVGAMASGTPLVLLAQGVGWRYTFVIMAGLNVVLALGLVFLVRDRPPDRPRPPAPAGGMFSGMRVLAASPSYWAISFSTFFRYGCLMALLGLWVVPWATYGLGLSQIQAGNAVLILAMSQVIGLPLSGFVSDRLLRSRKWVSLPAFACSAALIWAMQWLDRGTGPWVVYGMCLLIGLSLSPGQILYAHIKELMPAESSGAAMTGINLFTMLGPAAIMQAAGLAVAAEPAALAGPEGFSPAWILMSAGLALAVLVYAFVPDSKALAPEE
jgi:sugar phosphate permease